MRFGVLSLWIISFRQEDSEDWHLIVSVIIGLLIHMLHIFLYLHTLILSGSKVHVPHWIVQWNIIFVAHLEHFASPHVLHACDEDTDEE